MLNQNIYGKIDVRLFLQYLDKMVYYTRVRALIFLEKEKEILEQFND